MNRRHWYVILLWSYVALAWGGSFVAINIGLDSLPPIFFAATRLDIAAVIVFPLAWILGYNLVPETRNEIIDILVVGVFIVGITNVFLYIGLQHATSAVGAVLIGMSPIFAGLFAWVLVPKESPDKIAIVGLLLGIIGVGSIIDFQLSKLLTGTLDQFFLVMAAATLALGSVLSRRIDSPKAPLPTMAWGLAFGAVALHILSILINEQVSFTADTWTTSLWLSIAYIGVIATGGAYPAFFRSLREIGPVKTNLVSYASPVVAAIVGWFILSEPIDYSTIFGFMLVFLGFILVNYKYIIDSYNIRRPNFDK